jgi:uncharacterized protein
VTALAGGVVGLVLGNIRLPVVVAAATNPAAGAGANIGISAIAALTASTTHIRAGRIDWRIFWWTAPPSVVAAAAGGLLSGEVPGHVLLAVIGVTLLGFGVDLLRPRVGDRQVPQRFDRAAAVATGAVIGLLGGFVGLILGSLRIGALIRFVGADTFRAVGTNVAVGFCLGVAGVLGHLAGGVDWKLLGIGAGASIPGALLGARLTGRLDERQLLRAVGVLLLVAGGATLTQAFV